MMGDASKFLIYQRRQLRVSGIVAATPTCQEIGHFLLRNRGRVHNRFSDVTKPEKFLHAESVSEKYADHMSSLIAIFRLCRWSQLKNKQQQERKQHEFTNSVQKITNSADSAGPWLLGACIRAASIHTPESWLGHRRLM